MSNAELWEQLHQVREARTAIDLNEGSRAVQLRALADAWLAEAELWQAAAEHAAGRRGRMPWLEMFAYTQCQLNAADRAEQWRTWAADAAGREVTR